MWQYIGMRRRYYDNSDSDIFIAVLLISIVIGIGYGIYVWIQMLISAVIEIGNKIYMWFQQNLLWIGLTAVVLIWLFLWLKKKKREKYDRKYSQITRQIPRGMSERMREVTESVPGKVKEIKEILNTFVVDIPKFSNHSEVIYQVDFGRYLKEKLPNDIVVYEETKGDVRPDIVINKTIAIEIKALRPPDNKYNLGYNRKHVKSIYEKIFTYRKQYDEVIFIIFNARYVNKRNWSDYEKMKKTVQQEKDVVLFEK